MTDPSPREDRVKCCHCGAILGTISQAEYYARSRRQTSRIVTASPGVRAFVDLTMGRVDILCPSCGAIGRTLRRDRIRGVVVQLEGTG